MKIKNDTYNIDYASLSDSNRAWSIPVKADGTYRLGSEKNYLEYANEDGVEPIFNAVEIDWNGAKPGMGEDSTNGITTTVELIKEVYSPMFAKAA